MVTHNTSLKNLPSHVRLAYDLEGLLEIESPDINMVIWKREEDPDIKHYFENMPIVGKPCMTEFDENLIQNIRNLPKHECQEKIVERFYSLLEIMRRVQKKNNRAYLSHIDLQVNQYTFHQDPGFSLNWTINGPGALWVPNGLSKMVNGEFYEPPEKLSSIRQLEAGDIAIYKGEEVNSRVDPLVHSSPIREKGIKRTLIQIYL